MLKRCKRFAVFVVHPGKATLGNRSGANTLPFLVPHGEAQIAASVLQSISVMTRWRIVEREVGLPGNLLRVEFRRYLIATCRTSPTIRHSPAEQERRAHQRG